MLVYVKVLFVQLTIWFAFFYIVHLSAQDHIEFKLILFLVFLYLIFIISFWMLSGIKIVLSLVSISTVLALILQCLYVMS
ncbi:MAG: hypothetical protein WBV93_01955 [Anaerobacillus sp.]